VNESTPTTEDEHRFRMKDLCEATGLGRQAIHFYIQQGLLPPGRKTGRNMAWYSKEHIQRLQLIRRLQHERFLPLKAIKALFDGTDGPLSDAQARFLGDVRAHVARELTSEPQGASGVSFDDALRRSGLAREDLTRAVSSGLVGHRRADNGSLELRGADLWKLDTVTALRSAGFTRELGFEVDDLLLYDEAMSALLDKELRLLTERVSHRHPEEVATLLARALPILRRYIGDLHESGIRDLFSAVS
jgi:DNA-binding transcriptional MerR regulator